MGKKYILLLVYKKNIASESPHPTHHFNNVPKEPRKKYRMFLYKYDSFNKGSSDR
jgi:hypothetical protein